MSKESFDEDVSSELIESNKEKKIKASDLLVRCLETEGVEYIFGIPGEENADFMMSLIDSKIKFILTRHEQGAAFMADVYGRLTGKVGVCLATLGPGATNLTTGVANANMDRSRLLAITGQKNSHFTTQGISPKYGCGYNVCPYHKMVLVHQKCPQYPRNSEEGIQNILAEKPGAVHIELPQDIAKRESAIPPIPPEKTYRPKANQILIKEAADLILHAKKPLLFVGNGCIREDASGSIRRFTERTGICSMNTFMAKGVIRDDQPRHLRTLGIKDADHVLQAMKEADVVLAVGLDLVEYSPKNWNLDLDKKIIHVDFTPAEVYTFYRPAVEIVSDIESAMDSILEELERQKRNSPNLVAFQNLTYLKYLIK